MTRNYLDIHVDAHAKIRAVRGPNYSLDQKCQQMSGYYSQWAIQGNEVGINASSTAVPGASSKNVLVKGNINDAQPGELVYWANNHVMRILGHDRDGRAIGNNTSLKGDTIAGTKIDPFWKASHVDTYPATYIGRSARDGHSTQAAPYPIDAWPDVMEIVLSPDQRQVRADVGLVNVRAFPKLGVAVVETFAPGQIITVAGTVRGDLVTQNGRTTDLWFVTGTDGEGIANRYSWAGAYTDSTAAGLDEWHDPELEPEPSPPVEVPPVVEPEPQPDPETPVDPGMVPPIEAPPETTPPETAPPVSGRWTLGQALIGLGGLVAAIITYLVGLGQGWWT